MGINIKNLITKEAKHASKANRLIKEKEALYSKLDNAKNIEEKAKIEEKISRIDNKFLIVMKNLNKVWIEIDKEEINKISKPKSNPKTKFKSRAKKGRVYKKKMPTSKKATRMDDGHTKIIYESDDESKVKTPKIKPKSGIYTSKAREEAMANTEEQTDILSKILKLLSDDSKEDKKDKKKKSKLSKLGSRFGKKAGSGMSAFSGIMDKVVVGMGAMALLPQLKEMFFEGATDKDGRPIDPKSIGSLVDDLMKPVTKLLPKVLDYGEHKKYSQKYLGRQKMAKSEHLSKIEGVKTKYDEGYGHYLSKDLAQSKEWGESKKVIKKYKSYVTSAFDLAGEGGHMKGSSHYKGIKVDLGTRQITSQWKAGDEESQVQVSRHLLKFIRELFQSGATKILFEYTDDTPKDLVDYLKLKMIGKFKKQGWNLVLKKVPKEAGEHLDVKYDEKYSLKKEEMKNISKDLDKETSDNALSKLSDMFGVDSNNLKSTLKKRYETLRDKIARGDTPKSKISSQHYDPQVAQASGRGKAYKDFMKVTYSASDLAKDREDLLKEGYVVTKEGHIVKKHNIVKSTPSLRKPDDIQMLKDDENQMMEEKRSKERMQSQSQGGIVVSSNDDNSTVINNNTNGDKFGYIYDSESDQLLF